MANVSVDRALVYRASVLREWKDTESYAVFHDVLRERLERAVDETLAGHRDRFDHNVGFVEGLQFAMKLVEQTTLDESRQRPQEVAR